MRVAHQIIADIHYLIEDKFGNYLVQNVLKLQDPRCYDLVLEQISVDFVRLSQLKFSSNVIEICFGAKNKAIDKIFRGRVALIVGELVFHQFGNYVLQRAISSIVDNGLRKEILVTIKGLQPDLLRYKHGQKVV